MLGGNTQRVESSNAQTQVLGVVLAKLCAPRLCCKKHTSNIRSRISCRTLLEGFVTKNNYLRSDVYFYQSTLFNAQYLSLQTHTTFIHVFLLICQVRVASISFVHNGCYMLTYLITNFLLNGFSFPMVHAYWYAFALLSTIASSATYKPMFCNNINLFYIIKLLGAQVVLKHYTIPLYYCYTYVT